MILCMRIRGRCAYQRLGHCSGSWQFFDCLLSVHRPDETDQASIVYFPLSSCGILRGSRLMQFVLNFLWLFRRGTKVKGDCESRTSSVFCFPIVSSNKCLKFVSLSTASAAASSSAMLVLRETPFASFDNHPTACTMSRLHFVEM